MFYIIRTAQKMKFSIKDFFSKSHHICRKLRMWSHLLKKSIMENFIFSAVTHSCSNLEGQIVFIKQIKSLSIHHLQKFTIQKQPPEVFCKKGVLGNFTKFTGKNLRQSLFFNNVASLRPVTLLKKRLWHRCFPVTFVKFLRTIFFIEHPWWLLLTILPL